MFVGFVALSDEIVIPVLTRNASSSPIKPDSLPAYRVYQGDTLIATGTSARTETGAVTAASNNTPIVITSTDHGLTTGTTVTLESVGGNTAANGTYTITRIDENSFSLDSSVGNGAYTSGGTWHVTGLHSVTITPESADGYEVGKNYYVLVSTVISGVAWAETYTFLVT